MYLERIPRPDNNLGPDGKEFVWGPVIAIHNIGDFQIVESRNDLSNMFPVRDPSEHGKPTFHPYYKGRSMHRSAFSIDVAIVEAIAVKYDGANTRAADYFFRIVGEEVHTDYGKPVSVV